MKKFKMSQSTKEWAMIIGYTGGCVVVSVLTWKLIAKAIGKAVAKELIKEGFIAIAM